MGNTGALERIAISTARRDETLADDLDAEHGPVSTRVALLLRGAEGNPSFAKLVNQNPPLFDWELIETRQYLMRI